MGDRLRMLREELHLTRSAFGERMGVSGDVINNLERGRVELKGPMFCLVVRTFGVSTTWLREGTGEMFSGPGSAFEELVREYDLSYEERVLVERFLRLDKRQRDAVISYIRDVAGTLFG